VRRLVTLPIVLVVVAIAAGGCRHDGREMRPALPSQDGSVSTSAAPTTPLTEDDFFETRPTAAPTSSAATTGSTTTLAQTTSTVGVPGLSLTAPWRDGAPIDPRYSCKGENVSPALSWSAAPEGTQEIAVTMIDQDADFEIPAGAAAALNGRGATGYTGPCPPAGTTHTYRITVYFLDHALGLAAGGSGDDMRSAIEAATFASAQVTGTFAGS
jgi:phosphatidylethanolamine-binding protein (PEBP) family uncharacterized protein